MVVESTKAPPELVGEFVRVAHRVVWCTLVTVDRHGRPRSRVVHPIWEPGPLTGWVLTRPTPLKRAHLARTPYVSCSYWDPAHEVAVAECTADLDDDPAVRDHVRRLFAEAPEPLGYDAAILGGEDSYTVLRLTPWRLSTGGRAWRAA